MNIVILAFFSTNYLACAMPDPSMLRHAFDFIEKDWKILRRFPYMLQSRETHLNSSKRTWLM